MIRTSYDVIIVGGGIMGSATAYYLMHADKALKVAVIERDPSYSYASTTLSMSNIRIQFSLKENIKISNYTLKILNKFEDDMDIEDNKPNIGFHQEGNLFLVDEDNQIDAKQAFVRQKSLDCQIEWWSPQDITQHYPLYEPRDLVGGTFGPEDGYVDAYAVLMGYKAKARAMGADYIKDEVLDVTTARQRVTGVKLASQISLTSRVVINCAGAWAAQVANTAGVELPIVPVQRQVFALDTAVKPDRPLPLTVLPSGLYFRSETGGLILLGKSLPEDPVGFNFTWNRQRFLELLWPELVAFVPAFDQLKLVRGWAGLYAVNTLDNNAILGEWPDMSGFFLANGFSGHGLQQAPAVGLYLSEVILELPMTLDLSIFGPNRVIENKPLSEGGIV